MLTKRNSVTLADDVLHMERLNLQMDENFVIAAIAIVLVLFMSILYVMIVIFIIFIFHFNVKHTLALRGWRDLNLEPLRASTCLSTPGCIDLGGLLSLLLSNTHLY